MRENVSAAVRERSPFQHQGRQEWLRHAVGTGLLLAVVLHFGGCAAAEQRSRQKTEAREEAVRFTSGTATLAGTLVLPGGPSRHPAVVLFHGSGPQTRDLFTARWFSGQGVAALAYDKRGVGESTGDFLKIPFMDLADDGIAAVQLLKSRPDIDPKQIGVWGLSQGGWLGPLAASRCADVAFVIAVSGPGVSPGEQMVFYYANELRARGMKEGEVAEVSAFRRGQWNYYATGKGYEEARKEMEQARKKPWYNEVKGQQDKLFDPLSKPSEMDKLPGRGNLWFQKEAIYDPVPALRALQVPALFLFGADDEITPVPESVRVIRQVEAENGKRDFTVEVFPHADHGMSLTTGDNAGSVSPQYLATMRAWLAKQVRTNP